MSIVVAGLVAALLGGGTQFSGDTHGLKLSDFLACRGVADEPVCLLNLGAHSYKHRPYRDDINLAYAPRVLAAVKELPAPPGFEPYKDQVAAIAVILAVQRREPPARALAPIRAITPVSGWKGGPRVKPGAGPARTVCGSDDGAVFWRRLAYERVWEVSYGPFALPKARRPSRALLARVLDGWEADTSEDSGVPLVKARIAFGDATRTVRTARAIAPCVEDPIQTLLAAGLVDDAAAEALRISALPTKERLTWIRLTAGRRDLIAAANKAGKVKLASAVARATFDHQPNEIGPIGSFDLGPAVRHAARYWSRADAVQAFERLEARGQADRSHESAAFAAAAAVGWHDIGALDRSARIVADWTRNNKAPAGCRLGDCFFSPAHFFRGAIGNAGGPGHPLIDLGPEKDAIEFDADIRAGRTDRLEEHLARIGSPENAQRRLLECVRGAAGNYRFELAKRCAGRLEGGGARVANSLIYAAGVAAGRSDAAAMAVFMRLAYRAAEVSPNEPLPQVDMLPKIAIIQLRAQGRL
jgi:hypothetical protein